MDFHADIITMPVAVKVKAQYTIHPETKLYFFGCIVTWRISIQLIG